mmetsp:Transcript_30497/g.93239  ORF Transcript_30497/g.93239 Transcript_30497/m.93239 type:complete len:245 (+) Transcript_30497:935-1669(+)
MTEDWIVRLGRGLKALLRPLYAPIESFHVAIHHHMGCMAIGLPIHRLGHHSWNMPGVARNVLGKRRPTTKINLGCVHLGGSEGAWLWRPIQWDNPILTHVLQLQLNLTRVLTLAVLIGCSGDARIRLPEQALGLHAWDKTGVAGDLVVALCHSLCALLGVRWVVRIGLLRDPHGRLGSLLAGHFKVLEQWGRLDWFFATRDLHHTRGPRMDGLELEVLALIDVVRRRSRPRHATFQDVRCLARM